MRNKIIFLIVASLTMMAMVGILFYFGTVKQGFHMDELLTYGLANNHFGPFPFQFEEWLQSSYYHSYLTVNGSDAFAYDSVFYNQAADVHPPLYYLVIHTISSLFQEDFTKWIGIGANILFFVLIIGALFSLTKYLLQDKWLALLVTSFWGLSIGAVSSVMYIRMYVLLTLWFILFLFVTIKMLNENNHSWQLYLALFLVTVSGILTQYYFLIGAFFISFVLCLLFFMQKRWQSFLGFALTMSTALLTSYALFPAITKHLFETARGEEAVSNVVRGTNYFLEYLSIVDRSLFAGNGKILLFLVVLVMFVIGKNRGRVSNLRYLFLNAGLIIVPALLYILVIQKIAPYRTSRYIFSVYPAIVVGVFFVFIFALKQLIKNKHLIRLIMLLVVIASTLYAYRNEKVEYLYPEYEAIIAIAREYKGNDALVIHDAKWKITGNILELQEFKEILPLELNPDAIVLPDDKKLLDEERLIVFINKAFDQETMIDLITEKYGFQAVKQIYDHNATLVYVFE